MRPEHLEVEQLFHCEACYVFVMGLRSVYSVVFNWIERLDT